MLLIFLSTSQVDYRSLWDTETVFVGKLYSTPIILLDTDEPIKEVTKATSNNSFIVIGVCRGMRDLNIVFY